MKKLVSLALILTLVLVGMFAGTASAELTKDTIKVGLILLHDENIGYDEIHLNGFMDMVKNLGLTEDQYVIKYNIPENELCYDAAVDLAEAGCNIIFADSFGHESYMLQAATEYPDIQFCHATGYQAATSGLKNMHNFFSAVYESRYVSGVVAGLKLNEQIEKGEFTADEAVMCYVGAYPYAEVISGYTAFYLGARSVCPSVTMDVTFTNSWYDPTLEQEGANKLIKNGCVVISEHADSMGAPNECQQQGVPFVFYNGSAADACPDTYIVASRINWAPYLVFAMQCVMDGTEIPADWTGTIATDSVCMTELNEKAAAPGTAEKLEEVKAALADGSLKVFDTATFTVGGQTLTEYMADVDDMGDFVPDTNVISDGLFHESKFRSAPYFDIDIDGITNIDA